MLLQVSRPKQITTGRTQSYRVGLHIAPEITGEETAVLVCSLENGIRNFERVAEPDEIRTLPLDPSKPLYRTDTMDIYVAAKGLADNLVTWLVADLQALKGKTGIPQGARKLSGATV